ncbi:MAG: hypothetical protein WCO10_02690 [bacterium]
MNFDQPDGDKEKAEQRRKEIISLATEISGSQEIFSFPGVDQEAYAKIKAEDEEYPGCTTPIDEIIKRFKAEGIKVVLGKDPESGNVYILPAQSSDIENDGLFPKVLITTEGMNDNLKKLILLNRAK